VRRRSWEDRRPRLFRRDFAASANLYRAYRFAAGRRGAQPRAGAKPGKTASEAIFWKMRPWNRENGPRRRDTDDTKSAVREIPTIHGPVNDFGGWSFRMPTRASPSSRGPRRNAPRATPAKQTPTDERYALALESLNLGVYEWNIETGAVYYPPALRIMLGVTEQEVATPADWMARMHPDDLPLY